MIFWTHKIFLAMTKIFFEYHVGVKNAKNRRNLCPAISQQPIIRFSQDFACNTSFTWAKRHEASFGSDCCLPDRISKRRYILRPNIQILVIFSMHLKVIHFDWTRLSCCCLLDRKSKKRDISRMTFNCLPNMTEIWILGLEISRFFDILSSRQQAVTNGDLSPRDFGNLVLA